MAKTVVTLDGFTQHIVLYAKGHYESSGNMMVDLKKIIGRISGIDPEYAVSNNVFVVVMDTFLELSEFMPKEAVKRFWLTLYIKDSLSVPEEEATLHIYSFIKLLLSEIATIKVKNLPGEVEINIGRPDSNYLPVNMERK